MSERETLALLDKPNKTRAEWLILFSAGLAEYDPGNDRYKLNEIGLHGGWGKYQVKIDAMRARGAGPL